MHESVRINGQPEYLKGEILHFTYGSFSDYLKRLETYSSLAALDYHERGKRATAMALLAKPLASFVKAYVLKRGFMDGTPGFAVAVMGSVSVFFKYAKLHELRRSQSRSPK